jgi:hypothetical protein
VGPRPGVSFRVNWIDVNLIRGAGAGVVAFGIVYPLTTISTTMQVQSKKDQDAINKADTFSTILRVNIH